MRFRHQRINITTDAYVKAKLTELKSVVAHNKTLAAMVIIVTSYAVFSAHNSV